MYDGRGSVAQEISYNNSWYTLGGKIGRASISSKSYSPFGEMLSGESTGYGFNGESYDSATGMLNLRARQYEPAQMRFSQRDLLKGDANEPLSLNRYLYCTNDPVNYVDANGLGKENAKTKTSSADAASDARRMEQSNMYFAQAEAAEKKREAEAEKRRAENEASDARRMEQSNMYFADQVAAAARKQAEDAASDARRMEQSRMYRVSSVQAQIDNALGNVDRSKLSGAQQREINEMENELLEKAAAGTLTMQERDDILNRVCEAAGAKLNLGLEIAESKPEPSPIVTPLPQIVSKPDVVPSAQPLPRPPGVSDPLDAYSWYSTYNDAANAWATQNRNLSKDLERCALVYKNIDSSGNVRYAFGETKTGMQGIPELNIRDNVAVPFAGLYLFGAVPNSSLVGFIHTHPAPPTGYTVAGVSDEDLWLLNLPGIDKVTVVPYENLNVDTYQ